MCAICSGWLNPVMRQTSKKRGQTTATTMCRRTDRVARRENHPYSCNKQCHDAGSGLRTQYRLAAPQEGMSGAHRVGGCFEPNMCTREPSTWPQCTCLHTWFDCVVFCSFLASDSIFVIGQRAAWFFTCVGSVARQLLRSNRRQRPAGASLCGRPTTTIMRNQCH